MNEAGGMRFEIFRGPRSLASVTLVSASTISLRVHEEDERAFLIEHFGGRAKETGDHDVLLEGDWTALAFEIACLSLRHERGFAVVPRRADPAR